MILLLMSLAMAGEFSISNTIPVVKKEFYPVKNCKEKMIETTYVSISDLTEYMVFNKIDCKPSKENGLTVSTAIRLKDANTGKLYYVCLKELSSK